MRLSDLALDRPVATVMLLVSLMVLGVVSIFRLPLGFIPMIKEPEVVISVPFPGSHPLESLRQVVLPLEEEVATIPGVKTIFSYAGSGRAGSDVEFAWGTDLDLRKMEVREAVERARSRFPAGIGHVLVKGDVDGPAGGAILQGRISAERDLSESWDLLDRRIKRPLERVKGVARVSLYGVEPSQVRIRLDLAAMARHGVQPFEVMRRIDGSNVDLDVGAVHGAELRYDVRSLSRFDDIEQIRNLPLDNGGPATGLRVRDVAHVALEQPRLDYGRHLDRRFAIGIDVFKEPAANTVETVDRLLERMREVERDPELKGVILSIWVDQAEEIRSSLAGLRNSGIFGGLLAAVVLYLFLRRLKTTLIVLTAIPFSLLVTCGAMYLLGSEFNVLTMLGLMLGVGMLVDNAVVVIENIHRLEGKGIPAREAARIGTRQVSLAVLASTATSIIVWSWLFVAEPSHMLIYMSAVALTICLAVGCSLIISLTFIPLAAARFVPRKEIAPGFLLRRLVPAYRSLLSWTLRHRLLTLTAMLLLGASAAVPITLIEKSDGIEQQERAVSVRYQVFDPVSKEVLESYVDQVEEWIESRREELQYDNLYSIYQENQGASTHLYMTATGASRQRSERIRKLLREGLPEIPGVKLVVNEADWWRRDNSSRRRITVAIRGEDPEFLEDLAAEAEQRLAGIPGSLDVYGPSIEGRKELRVRVDPERARAAGVTPEQVADRVGFAFRGASMRRFQGETGEIEMLMGLVETGQDVGAGLALMSNLPVLWRAGNQTLPLAAVADISVARTAPGIRRVDRKTTTWVGVEFDKEVTTEKGRGVVSERLAGLNLPVGYSWDWGEQGRERDDALGFMLRGVMLALLVVILLMAALFESISQPFAIIITLPLAFFGAFWTLWLVGYELNAVAFMGVIILIGIVVNNGIVMVDHVNHLRREGMPRREALVEGCGDRLRPVLMTAITTIFGLLPLAFSAFTVGTVYIDSLPVAVLGGLATSALFTLVALPVWYTTIEDLAVFLRRLLPASATAPRRARGLPGGAG